MYDVVFPVVKKRPSQKADHSNSKRMVRTNTLKKAGKQLRVSNEPPLYP